MELIRFKLPGACVLELDASTIEYFNVCAGVDEDENDCHVLMVGAAGTDHVLHFGTFDECHYKLNQLHDVLNIKITDL